MGGRRIGGCAEVFPCEDEAWAYRLGGCTLGGRPAVKAEGDCLGCAEELPGSTLLYALVPGDNARRPCWGTVGEVAVMGRVSGGNGNKLPGDTEPLLLAGT